MQLNELLDIIKNGESDKIEFKTKVTSDIGEEICAIANGFGGLLLIGIDDKGKVQGCNLETSKFKISDHTNSITPPVKINFDHFKIDDKDILILDIPQSTDLCSIWGVAYIRIGTSKRPLSMQEIFTIGAENLLYEIDKTPTDMKPDDSLVEEFYKSSRTEIADIGSYLKRIGAITSDGYLSLAGLLLFYPEPEAIIPHASIRVIKSDGTWKRYSGSFIRTIKEVERDIAQDMAFYPIQIGFVRKDVPEYPIKAIREALVNAVTHRNYAIKSEVFVEYVKDGLQIRNPGSFPPGTTPEDPIPIPRNPILYELMFQSRFVERQGRGIDLIKEECEKHPLVDFSYNIRPNYTSIKFTKTLTNLSEEQMDLLGVLSYGDSSSSEISRRMGISKGTVIRIVDELMRMNLIEKIGSGPTTRYRLKP